MTSLHFDTLGPLPLPLTHSRASGDSPGVPLRGLPRGVTGGVRSALRAEGLLLLTAAIVLYVHAGYSGSAFAVLFLVPDLSLFGYLGGPRTGALAYNVAHSLVGPLSLGIVGALAVPSALPYGLIWAAHIGMDRALGYGLKYGTAFGHTHLGRVGAAVRGN